MKAYTHKPCSFCSMLFLILLGIIPIQNSFAQATKSTSPVSVAILDLSSQNVPNKELGSECAALLNVFLSQSDHLILVERTELDKLLAEQGIGLSGTITSSSAAQIGQLTGAKVLVTGKVFNAGKKTYIITKIIGTETSRVFGEKETVGTLNDLEIACEKLSTKIETLIKTRSHMLLAPIKTRDSLISELAQGLDTSKLPTLRISIQENHIGRSIIDPAAETELISILTQLGFKVIGEGSNQAPDLTISGEAFSEFAMSMRDFVSCRGRVELKVTQTKTKEIIFADREMGVAVDLAENIAAKKALQTTSTRLAERLVNDLKKRYQ